MSGGGNAAPALPLQEKSLLTFVSSIDSDGGHACEMTRAIADQVHPIESALIRKIVTETEDRVIVCVVEAAFQPNVDELLHTDDFLNCSFSHEERYDGVAIIIGKATEDWRFQIIRTRNSTVPIYVAFQNARVAISWDFWLVAESIDSPRPNVDMCRRFLIEGPGFYRDSLIEGIFILGGGHQATCSRNDLRWGEPNRFPRYEAGVLAPGAEVSEVFLDMVADSLRPALQFSSQPVIEVSGGQDSSCVVGALPRAGVATIRSYALMHSGVSGAQQGKRRQELIDRFNLLDHEVPSSDSRPFTALTEGRRVVPFDEIYRYGIEECLDALDGPPPEMVITGLGGDELTLVDDEPQVPGIEERVMVAQILFGAELGQAPEMPSFVAGSAVTSAFCRADMFLTRGIWPKNPFAEPQFAQFSQILPKSLKIGRRLNQITLAKLGLSDYFLFPRFRENFKRVYEDDLRAFDLDHFFIDSWIQELGIASISALSIQFQSFINTGRSDLPSITFVNFVRLECMLRRLLGAVPSQDPEQ